MKTKITAFVIMLLYLMISSSVFAEGYLVTPDLWIKAVINTVEKGPIEAVWQKGGEDTTSRGDRVIWGHFYASPSDVTWGSENNPDLFVKIWFDVSGRIDVNFFHVSVPDIVVYSDYPYDGTPDEQGTTTMSRRYIRQYYEGGQSHSEENYEDGNPPSGYSPTGNPSGYSTINALRIGSIINTVEIGPIEAVWRFGGQDTTARGDQVVWGHFYADPSDVTWGSENNPDLFVKIWFDVSGRVDVNFFHVSVPDIEVYSDLPDDSTYDRKGTTIMDNRYIRHEYPEDQPPGPEPAPSEFMPLTVGNTWDYRMHDGFLHTHSVTNEIYVGNERCFVFDTEDILANRSDGLYIGGEIDDIYGEFLLWWKYPCCVGDTWTYVDPEFGEEVQNRILSISANVSTDAGNFNCCILLEKKHDYDAWYGYVNRLYWGAPGVGWVKQEVCDENGVFLESDELVSYTIY